MPTERMEEVEVVGGHQYDPATGRSYAFVAPGSLTAARLRLADAAEAWMAKRSAREDDLVEWVKFRTAHREAAALRTARGE